MNAGIFAERIVGMGDFQVHLNAIKFYKNCRGAIQ
jgi:hypothetical protein